MRDRILLGLRVVSGAVFIAFGAGKFLNHASELASFTAYGVPAPELFVVVIGVIELVGGALLIAGILVWPAALLLAGDMVGAIVVSGIAKGELVSLTLAPALLAAMVMLLRASVPLWLKSGSRPSRPGRQRCRPKLRTPMRAYAWPGRGCCWCWAGPRRSSQRCGRRSVASCRGRCGTGLVPSRPAPPWCGPRPVCCWAMSAPPRRPRR